MSAAPSGRGVSHDGYRPCTAAVRWHRPYSARVSAWVGASLCREVSGLRELSGWVGGWASSGRVSKIVGMTMTHERTCQGSTM